MSGPIFDTRNGVTTGDIRIVRGDTLDAVLEFFNENGTVKTLTGYSAKLQVRSDAESATVILEASTAAGTLVVGGAAGTITMAVAASTTAALTPGRYVYDLQTTSPDGNVTTEIIQHVCTVVADVTRAGA
jgi:hypothetical protein